MEGTLGCDGEKFQGDRQYILSDAFCWNFCIRGRKCATDVPPLLFVIVVSGAPFSSAQKVFLPAVQIDGLCLSG